MAGFGAFLVIWNQRQGLSTPRVHFQMAAWLQQHCGHGDRKLLLLAFRHSGKSTLIGLYCAWRLYRNPDTRILVLSGEFNLAKKMVRNVRRVIEQHPLTGHLRPTRLQQWASDQFTVRRSREHRDASMAAKGITSNITGMHADLVICDDVEVPNTCETAEKRRILRERLSEISYVLSPGGQQIYVGTPHTFHSIYFWDGGGSVEQGFTIGNDCVRLEVPLINEHGESAWPERFPMGRIQLIREETGPNKFDSQMLLKPRDPACGRLHAVNLRRYSAELKIEYRNGEQVLRLGSTQLVSATCWWDPSFGAPAQGDASVIAAVFADGEGYRWLHRVAFLQHDAALADRVDEATQLCRQVCDFVRQLSLPSVCVEVNGIGRFLPGLLRRELRAAQLRCAVVERLSVRSKQARIIEAFDAILAARRLWVHDSVWRTRFIDDLREWHPGRRGGDDTLDAVAGCLLSEPARLAKTPLTNSGENGPWRGGTRQFRAISDFIV